MVDRIIDSVTVIAALGALAIAGVVLFQYSIERPSLLVNNNEERQVLDWPRYVEGGRQTGPVDAVVTILEFGDYECSACRVQEAHLEVIRRRYPNDVNLVYRHWPLPYHDRAYVATRAAECAGAQGQFWPFHRLLYARDHWLEAPVDEVQEPFMELAEEARIEDLEGFRTCLDDPTPVSAIEDDIAAAEQLGAIATPTLIINGRMFTGFQDSMSLDSLIQEILP